MSQIWVLLVDLKDNQSIKKVSVFGDTFQECQAKLKMLFLRYLLERKEAMLKEKLEKEAELAQASCPEGHILLPDQERKDTLTMLKKSKKMNLFKWNCFFCKKLHN